MLNTVVFYDIHGNIYALEAMLRQLENDGVEQFFFCGDIMGYFPWQEKVIEHFQKMPYLYAVLGNHDAYYLQTADGSPERMAYARKYGKSYANGPGDAGKAYLRSLPHAIELYQEGKKILIVHGSAAQHLEGRVYADTEVETSEFARYDLVFSGHTHYRMKRKIGHTILLNPGSLGQPRDDQGYSYCLIDMKKEEFLFRNVCVDQEQLLHQLRLFEEDKRLLAYLKSKM